MKITSLIVKLIIIVNAIITLTVAQPTIIRCCHGSTVVNNKLYVGGGLTGPANGKAIFTNDFFSLDLANPFSTSIPNDIPYEVHAKVPVKSEAHTLVYAKKAKKGMIYLFGGFRQPPKGSAIYGYDLEKNAWSSITPNVRDGIIMPVESTTKIIGVTDNSFGTVYIFDNGTMLIYNVMNNFLDASSPAPFNLIYYAAVMLNTSEIAYIGGGYNDTTNVPMEQVKYFKSIISLLECENHINKFYFFRFYCIIQNRQYGIQR
jgi:hypothetical protein